MALKKLKRPKVEEELGALEADEMDLEEDEMLEDEMELEEEPEMEAAELDDLKDQILALADEDKSELHEWLMSEVEPAEELEEEMPEDEELELE